MKTIENTQPFDAVAFMRRQRDRLSNMLLNMNKAEIIEHFRKEASETAIKPYA
jgi:hypothetical protein